MSLLNRRNVLLLLLGATAALLVAAWIAGGSVETRTITEPVALPESAR
ncbi:hypothetical protein ACXYN8_07945 [Altererythrobacter sp. CAU 1778]